MNITGRERKVIISGAVAAAAILVFYAVNLQLPNSESLAQEVDFKKKLLLKQREILSNENTYEERMEEYARRLEQNRLKLLPGDNPNVAGAELQKLLMDFASQSGVEITQKNQLPEKNIQDILTQVSIRIQANCDPEQLVNFLTAIQNYGKFLKVEEFTITGIPVLKKYRIRPSLTVVGYIASQKAETAGENPETGKNL